MKCLSQRRLKLPVWDLIYARAWIFRSPLKFMHLISLIRIVRHHAYAPLQPEAEAAQTVGSDY